MDQEILFTGIGGQGVQLAAQVLARAAIIEDLHVLLLGTYGGTMRGGNTDATLIVGDAPLTTPPIVSEAGAALALHDAFWGPVAAKLRTDARVVLNASLFQCPLDEERYRVFPIPATQLAREAGSPMAASMVLVGSYSGLTGLVGIESLVTAMGDSLPDYRAQHRETNERALRAGFDAARTRADAGPPEEARA